MIRTATIGHFFPRVDAALSQNTFDHHDNLFEINGSSLDQARGQLNVKHNGRLNPGFAWFNLCPLRRGFIAAGI